MERWIQRRRPDCVAHGPGDFYDIQGAPTWDRGPPAPPQDAYALAVPWSHQRPMRAVVPPSTYSTWPVTKSAASDTRKATAGATSGGRPTRPRGTILPPSSLV